MLSLHTKKCILLSLNDFTIFVLPEKKLAKL